MKITIFGTGYVGLVTGTCLAEVGHEVMCIDIDQTKVDNLKEGIIPIYEPGLEELVKRNFKEGRLHFSTDAKKGVEFATAIFSAVGTPPDKNHRADLQYVKAVSETVGKYMTEYKVFVNKSTVPVGTGDICKEIIDGELEKRAKVASPLLTSPKGRGIIKKFDIVSNPEFLKEGVAVRDFMLPDRIVCGVESEKAKKMMQEIYKPFVRTNRPLIFTDIKSAEIIKYAANAFLATKISFINEIANFSELAGANISEISKGIGLDERIGPRFLHAGIGYGGSCFPKDVQALIETGKDFGYDFEIIKSVEKVNEKQKLKVVEKLLEKFNTPIPLTGTSPLQEEENMKILKGKTIAIWGLAFKPKTDDIRDAPSLSVISKLLELGVEKIQAFDPVAMYNVERYYSSPLSNFPPKGERIAT
ncbi:UDP-glucose/GDP-mannose dehydrogenase family protein, partial [Candidatus Gracilibacteria bacterium]|nr:UDP-glucose/GDP-mannose dehydrogenase family protein [Candidatus Gracilibacteria bacterium]